MYKKKIFSGIQPTGKITLGNFLSIIKTIQKIKNKYFCLLCIADLHSLITSNPIYNIQYYILCNIAFYLSIDINVYKTLVFKQSDIKEHTELMWILSCFSPLHSLNNMTQFKNKNKYYSNVGIYIYPILMISDIILYNSNFVLIGIDQKQHIELVNSIIQIIKNIIHKNVVIGSIPIINYNSKKVMNLQRPHKKMSKSDVYSSSTINMSDTPKEIRKKILKAKTDSLKGIKYDALRIGIKNLLKLYFEFTDISSINIKNKFSYCTHNNFKKLLFNIVIRSIISVNGKFYFLMKKKLFLKEFIERGKKKINIMSKQKILSIKKILKFY